MRSRISFILRYYVHLVVVFTLQKPLFMLFTGAEQKLRWTDFLQVMYKSLPMDLCVAAYLCGIPLIVALISLLWKTTSNFNPRIVLKPYSILVSAFLALIFVTDISLYPFWQFKLDASVFIYLSNPADATASVSTGYIIIRILAVIAYTLLIFTLLNRTTPKRFNSHKAGESKVLSAILLLVAGGLLFLAIRGGVKESTMNVGRVYFSENQYLNHSAVNPVFSLFSSIGKSKDLKKEYSFTDNATAFESFNKIYNQGRDTLLLKKLLKHPNPNVLIIEMESFGTTYTDPQEAGMSKKHVTPHYWEIAREGILFENMWCNSYRTDRGTVSIFSGHPALPKTSLMKQPKIVEYLPKLAASFLKNGYSTHFLYGGDINFTNTKGYLITNGFRNIIADTDFPSSEQKTNKWGVDDAITFKYLKENIQKLQSPWFYSFLTLSSHEPFDVPEKILEDKVYNAAAYTDKQLGMFINSIKTTPIWDSLLIIILPDHNMLYKRKYAPDYFRCRMIWTGGAVAYPGSSIKTIMNQSDLASTLLAQMQWDITDFPLSRNILSPNYSYQSAFCCYNNGFIVADTTGAIAYDLDMQALTFPIDNTAKDKPTAIISGSNKVETGKALLQSISAQLDKSISSE